MATPPDFSSGAVLTAAQMNSVGCWLVKTQTVGTGVSSVTVTGAFSADYDNYLITDTGGAMSSDTAYRLTFDSANTQYYYTMIYGSFAGGAVNLAAGNNDVLINYAGGSATRNGHIEVQSPFAVSNTEIRARVRYATIYGTTVALHASPTSFTSFTITPAAGTMTGGTIRVYGYRN